MTPLDGVKLRPVMGDHHGVAIFVHRWAVGNFLGD
jgi:hypothetical protein